MLSHSWQNLTLEQTQELHDDIERYLTLEDSEVNIDFWTVSIRLICFGVQHTNSKM